MSIIYKNRTKTSGTYLSDAVVLLTTLCLFFFMVLFPVFRTVAETETQGVTENKLDVVFNEKDYTVLLSSLFGRVGREIPGDAFVYTRDIDKYRTRIAHGIEENNDLTLALITLIQNYPKGLVNGYRQEIAFIQDKIQRQRRAMLPYMKSDVFLSETVVSRYGLHSSFVNRLITQANRTTSLEEIKRIQDDSYAVRREIALLYIRVRSVARQ